MAKVNSNGSNMPVVVMSPSTGMVHKTTLQRLRTGHLLPSAQDMLEDVPEMWGANAHLTELDVKALIVRTMAEGPTIAQALEHLEREEGKMPSKWIVAKWLKNDPQFRSDYKLAQSMQGELMVDAAREMAANSSPDTAKADKVAIQHLQWEASKIARDTFGDERRDGPPEEIRLTPEAALIRELRALMKDKDVANLLSVKDQQDIIDVAVEPTGEVVKPDASVPVVNPDAEADHPL